VYLITDGGACTGATARRQVNHIFSIMVSLFYCGTQNEYEIKTTTLGVGSVTMPFLFS
jgi:hypothetical protein